MLNRKGRGKQDLIAESECSRVKVKQRIRKDAGEERKCEAELNIRKAVG